MSLSRRSGFLRLPNALARLVAEAGPLLDSFREISRGLAPDRALFDVKPLSVLVDEATGTARFLGALLFTYGLVALGLAVFGLYAALVFQVADRRRELGFRAAIGASGRDLMNGIAMHGVRVILVGVSAGLLMGWFMVTAAEGLVFGFDVRDPGTFLIATAVTAVVSMAALFQPALSAASTHPMEALKAP